MRDVDVSPTNKEQLEGITLRVYLYAVKKGSPVGPRDVVKGAHLSSPSVAYRHLEKLEDMGLLQKNEYGEYVTKGKAHLHGYVWIGRRLAPTMLIFSLIFLSVLIVELYILLIHYAFENFEFVVFFVLLTLVTGSATAVFGVEAFLQRKRLKEASEKNLPS